MQCKEYNKISMECDCGGDLPNQIKELPNFGWLLAEVSKRWNPDDKSVNQQAYLMYEVIKEWMGKK